MNPGLLGKAAKDLILMLSPFVPHICEEMWEHMGQETIRNYYALAGI